METNFINILLLLLTIRFLYEWIVAPTYYLIKTIIIKRNYLKIYSKKENNFLNIRGRFIWELYDIIFSEKICKEYIDDVFKEIIEEIYDIEEINKLFKEYEVKSEEAKLNYLVHLKYDSLKYKNDLRFIRSYDLFHFPSKKKISKMHEDKLFLELLKTKKQEIS